jgi:hypothetical protein
METIESLLPRLRALTRTQFERENAMPFLLLRAAEGWLKSGKPGFHTETIPAEALTSWVKQLDDLKRESRCVLDEAHELHVFRVQKRPGNPYPEQFSIGRTSMCDIVIPDGRVSKVHARILLDRNSERYCVTDAGSHNGTKLNGKIVPKGKPVAIEFGDTLLIGGFPIEFLSAGQLYERLTALIVPIVV